MVRWGWKRADSPDDVHAFINGLESYPAPPDDAKIAAIRGPSGLTFFVFYRRADGAPPSGRGFGSWGWKRADTIDDAHAFINGQGAYRRPVHDFELAAARVGRRTVFYVFYTSRVPADDIGGWGWTRKSTVGEAVDFLNGTAAKRARIAAAEGKPERELFIFYQHGVGGVIQKWTHRHVGDPDQARDPGTHPPAFEIAGVTDAGRPGFDVFHHHGKQTMKEAHYLVDSSLGAVRVDQLLRVQRQLRQRQPLGSTASEAGDLPVLTGDQELEPNELYPSANQQRLRYYLPLYRVAVREGKPEVELHYGENDSGEVGRLTLALTWQPPDARGVTPRVMEHVADLSLRYQVPTESEKGERGVSEDVIPLQPLQTDDSDRARSVTVFTEKSRFDAVYHAMRDPSQGATLEVRVTARVGVRTWRQILVGDTASLNSQVSVLERSGSLFTQVLSKESLATLSMAATTKNTASVAVRKPTEAELTGVRAVRAKVVQPQMVAHGGVAATAARAVAARPVSVSPKVAAPASPKAIRVATPAARKRAISQALKEAGAASATGAKAGTREADRAKSPAAVPRPAADLATLARVNAPQLKRAVAASDLRIRGAKAIPLKIALDPRGEPAIVEAKLSVVQAIPFSFDPAEAANSEVFSVSGLESGDTHFLKERVLSDASGWFYTVYEDNLTGDLHVAPSEFRLMRSEESPFLPGLIFAPQEFATSEDEDQAELLYHVFVSYELRPWIKPKVIDLAQEELTKRDSMARLVPIVPRQATLKLDLDFLGEAQDRDDATVELQTGIKDDLILEHNEFVKLWGLLSQRGISGSVSYTLFDDTEAQSTVNMSLSQTSGELFDVSSLGPVEGSTGRYRVLLRNRIESPVVIDELPREPLADGVVAEAVDVQDVLGKSVKPGRDLTVDYQVTPADMTPFDLKPAVIGRVEPDTNTLLRGLMVKLGYGSRSFTLTVTAPEDTFAFESDDGEPLSGLLVQFDDFTEVELSPTEPEAEVSLLSGLLPQLLGEADDKDRYFYRVTNLHPAGEGARTGWHEGHSRELTVVPVDS